MNCSAALYQIPVKLGLIQAEIDNTLMPAGLDEAFEILLEVREAELSRELDLVRKAARDMLRNGTYKPTGRGKPASEFLLKMARDKNFPRINPAVDINNYISLKYMVPISLWDLEKAESDDFLFRLGRENESYIFNPSGQLLDLQDLIIGCAVHDHIETPMLSPIKDGQRTKTDAQTKKIGAAVYYPALPPNPFSLEDILEDFTVWLNGCGEVKRTWILDS